VAFSPTGRRLAFTRNVAGSQQLVVLDLATKTALLQAAHPHESLHQLAFLSERDLVVAGRDVKLGPAMFCWTLPS
jgi:hypothetical protein